MLPVALMDNHHDAPHPIEQELELAVDFLRQRFPEEGPDRSRMTGIIEGIQLAMLALGSDYIPYDTRKQEMLAFLKQFSSEVFYAKRVVHYLDGGREITFGEKL